MDRYVVSSLSDPPPFAIATLRIYNNSYDRWHGKLFTPIQQRHPLAIVQASEWQDSLGYGEIIPETVFLLIHWMQTHSHLKHRPMTVFDLGSGDGKVILATALCLDASTNLVGLEIVPDLHNQAMVKLQHYWTEVSQGNARNVEFHCDDFTQHAPRIARDADLIWVHATVFGDTLFAKVQEICESCRPGTLFVLVSRPLVENTIETLLSARLKMSWGDGMVFVQRRKQQ
jgi:SAM-dependent methyltransferase